jgi:hypothetical protein
MASSPASNGFATAEYVRDRDSLRQHVVLFHYGVEGTVPYRSVMPDAKTGRLCAASQDLLDALRDMLSGWRYIRSSHGDLYGVGWDRAQSAAEAAIAKATGQPAAMVPEESSGQASTDGPHETAAAVPAIPAITAGFSAHELLLREAYEFLKGSVVLPARGENLRDRLRDHLQINCGVCNRECNGHAVDISTDSAREAELEKALRTAVMALENMPLTHEHLCNGVHAENGACEGEYQHARMMEWFRSLLPAPSPAFDAPANTEATCSLCRKPMGEWKPAGHGRFVRYCSDPMCRGVENGTQPRATTWVGNEIDNRPLTDAERKPLDITA